MSEIVFGNAPKPPIIEMICEKPYEGAGFTRVSPRKGRLVGVCNHITAGRGSIEWYRDFFSTGGQRQYDALVDFVIGRDGRIGMLNDPFGTRAPWANGGTDGMEGGGPAFYARFGAAGINQRLYSTEHEGTANEDWTPELWASSIVLDVWMLDGIGMRWDTCPIHPEFLISTVLHHGEFTGKGDNSVYECAGRYYRQNEDRYVAELKAGLRAVQEVIPPAEPEPEPPAPVEPDIYPKGWTYERARKRFGRLRRHHLDGSITEHRFNPKGMISLLWIARVRDTGLSPEAQDHFSVADNDQTANRTRVTVELITFENGWILFRPAERATWEWIN